MNAIKFIILLNLINIIVAITENNGLRFRNFGLRLIVFKEKKINKMVSIINNNLQKCHDKVVVYVADCINSYNEFSEDEKILIETAISLFGVFIPDNITANQYQYSGKDKFKT
jgi:hypothetical protein